MTDVSDDDLGILIAAAASYDVRLPHGLIPERLWDRLTPWWRDRIAGQQDDDCIPGIICGTERRRLRKGP